MSSREGVTPGQQFQFRLTIENWIAKEFERVGIQHEDLIDVLDQAQFFGVNGLIQLENKKVSPFYFQVVSSFQKEENCLLIVFSVPIFQALDNISLQTGMEYFASVLRHTVCERKSIESAEVEAFSDIKRLHPFSYKEQTIIPYEDFTNKIELQTRMKVRMGLQIIPVAKIVERMKYEKMRHLKEFRIAKRALANIQSNLKEYSQKISKKYSVDVEAYLFQTRFESQFEPLNIPIFTLNTINQAKEVFSVLVIAKEVINRITERELEILIAHEVIFDLLKNKFSRGPLEREIYLIMTKEGKDDPEYLIEKELSKFFNLEDIKNTQNKIKTIINDLIAEKYPIMRLE